MSSPLRRTTQDASDKSVIEEKLVKANGDITFRNYKRGRFLGKGGFARVYELISTDNSKPTAAKFIPKASLSKPRARQKLMSEIKIHRSLQHKNIVAFDRFFEDNENVYILLEICQNQTLSEMMRRRKRLTELEAQCYLSQVLSALGYLHTHRVIHRDIKLGNLFLSEKMEIKLGDFGLATKLEFEGERKRTICGTPNYIAPEIIDGKTGHSYEVDVWSVGVLLYTLVVGRPPFETTDVKTTYRRIKTNAYSFPEHVKLSNEVKNLISQILHTEPKARPSLKDIANHPFLCNTVYPELMPPSTLAVPPSPAFLKKYESADPTINTIPKGEERTERGVSVRPRSSTPLHKAVLSSYNPPASFSGVTLWVKKWVDYSTKYGLGYLLSNSSVGVYFNDSTKILCLPDASSFLYVKRVGSGREEDARIYSVVSYPPELQKKVMLLTHFRKHLVTESPSPAVKDFTYIKKWLTTPHAVIFRLSNKTVQVSFQDKTEIILCSATKLVTYVNKLGNPSTYELRTAAESGNSEMTKRLKYTKEVLTSVLKDPVII